METQEHQENKQNERQQSSTAEERNGQALERSRAPGTPARRREEQSYAPISPFSLMRRFSDDMDRIFDQFFGSSLGSWGGSRANPSDREATWWPQIEVTQRDDKLVVLADVPGLKRDDIKVELHQNELRISGERRSESERTEGGYHRSERSYGSFSRSIELPDGIKLDTASATFENGVLKIEIEAPYLTQGRGRLIEVREGPAH
jgi:HSP20 family protein